LEKGDVLIALELTKIPLSHAKGYWGGQKDRKHR